MKLNERGSSLVTVLMVVLIFSVLGLALMGNVVNENKRVMATESDVQARYLAENGLAYFETSFNSYIKSNSYKTNSNKDIVDDLSIYLAQQFVSQYQIEKSVGDPSNPAETKIKAEFVKENNEDVIKVTSTGTAGSFKKTLIGYYKPNIFVDIDSPTYDVADFSKEGKAIDFSNMGLASFNLLNLVNLNSVKTSGNDNKFYQVPTDNIIKFKLLGSLASIDLGLGERFKTMEDNRVIATSDSSILEGRLVRDFVSILINYNKVEDTNVLINGRINSFTLAGNPIIRGYQDINFKKFAVLGSAIIQKERDDILSNNIIRNFTFDEGFYVNKSLAIRGSDSFSQKLDLKLKGDIVVMGNLDIKDINLLMGYKTTQNNSQGDEAIYVHGDVTLDNACINTVPDSYEFRLFTKGKITIKNTSDCIKSNVLLYAGNGINIITNNQNMTIKGGLIGSLDVDHPEKLKVVTEGQYLNRVTFDGKLISKGRTF